VVSGTKTESPQYTYEYEYEYYDEDDKNVTTTTAATAQVPETTERETTSSLLSLLTFLGKILYSIYCIWL
jgi:hypothetical protein